MSQKENLENDYKTNIHCSGFYILFAGDPSVGIFDETWNVEGDFYFENKEELEFFREKLKETWELVSDTPIGVESFEEYNERIKLQEKYC
ncbi:MAG: hypothetical protein ACOC2W_01915 [bacterium]